MDRRVVLRPLLCIVLLLSFASCTLPARLLWKSSPSPAPAPAPYDYIQIGQPSHSSHVNPSLYDIIPIGQPASSSLSLSLSQTQITYGTVKPIHYIVPASAPASSSASDGTVKPIHYIVPASAPASSSSSCNCSSSRSSSSTGSGSSSKASASANCSCASSSWLPPASASSPPENFIISIQPPSQGDYTPSRQPSPSLLSTIPSASRGGLNLAGKMGTAIAVILVSLVIMIVLIKAFKIKKAAGRDKSAKQKGQLGNPGGNSSEAGIIDIRTDTGEELSCLEKGSDICTYTKEELAKATNNFTTKIGHGVSGFVYRATLSGDRIGAVKRATDLDPILFKQELSVLLRLPRHPHLVDLIGLCLQAGERILVFEFISNGNLYDRLHKNKGKKGPTGPLSWAARMDIAFQVAVALQYLHEEAKPPILHRDVKSANILLEDDNCAKLADFGLSKLGPKNNQFTITAVRGSYGYMDPQYVKTRRYSAKSDVYSFGVLLLELMTGLKPLHEDTPLAEWTQTYRLSEAIDRFMTIVDRNMTDHINTMELQNMIKVANLCLRDISEERSSMREIVNMMQESRSIKQNGNLSDGGEAPLLVNG